MSRPRFDLGKIAFILRKRVKEILEDSRPRVKVTIKDDTLYLGAATVKEESWIENFWAFISNKENEAVIVHLEHKGSDIWNGFSGYITLFDDGKVVVNGSYYTIKDLFEEIIDNAEVENET